ncbi:unnamed protein product [Owenia fusiformis]|uniref:Uncharacterized protein n=1 Tax=Owenia fusiformis TaxID=6347 RepID=A0A8J1U9D9_OWEFU|nr:unnamed protein product [Owenia fusiformis]
MLATSEKLPHTKVVPPTTKNVDPILYPRARTLPILNTGQCQNTIMLKYMGYQYPAISEQSYKDRSAQQKWEHKRGSRPMHKTTLSLESKPMSDKDTYTTTSKQFHGGRKDLAPAEIPTPGMNMHMNQFNIGPTLERQWGTQYGSHFRDKKVKTPFEVHYPSYDNFLKQTEGTGVKSTIKTAPEPPSYWSQYNRIHSKLGMMRGNGVAREYPVRASYNILTGEETGPAWQEENRRSSGNRVLYSKRQDADERFILG